MTIKIKTANKDTISVAGDIHISEAGGAELKNISRMVITATPDDVIRAELEIAISALEIQGAVESYVMWHPVTGEQKTIRSITFDDGSTFEAS